MISKKILLVILSSLLIISMSISIIYAVPYDLTFDVNDIQYTNNEMVWIIPIKLVYSEHAIFDGQDVDPTTLSYSLKIWYNIVWDGDEIVSYDTTFVDITTPIPKKISLADSQIKIWWDSEELEAIKTDGSIPYGTFGVDWIIANTLITGETTLGDTFLATGPGWTSAFRPR